MSHRSGQYEKDNKLAVGVGITMSKRDNLDFACKTSIRLPRRLIRDIAAVAAVAMLIMGYGGIKRAPTAEVVTSGTAKTTQASVPGQQYGLDSAFLEGGNEEEARTVVVVRQYPEEHALELLVSDIGVQICVDSQTVVIVSRVEASEIAMASAYGERDTVLPR